MFRSLLRTDKEIEELYERHSKTVYRVCYAYMKNPADTEDAVQETFYRLINKGPWFKSAEHEKAWLIRTAANICKDELKHWRRKCEDIDEHTELRTGDSIETDEVLEAVMELPDKYKTVIYLYYYEGYNSAEIAEILKKPGSTVRNHLHEARGLLKERLGEYFNEK
ncbi:MAG: RNA polymerase sigma factor [Ruminococcus sp.]|uniref:RNA polymerase sigma factor n=1 Tax=Ruminococcus sp. TaxID=41978 RepID=UPI0025E5E7B4|nr:RNA polymerase sigma factor [Ruminococcus sp.]MBR5683418.1 RNA polymerase sigma factor [Ruminococcus sp.]